MTASICKSADVFSPYNTMPLPDLTATKQKYFTFIPSLMGGNVVVQIKQAGLDPNIGTGIKYTL